MNETREIVRFIRGMDITKLPPEVITKAKELVLDQLGCQMAFAALPWSRQVYDYISSRNCTSDESSIVYYGTRTTAEDAAFVNATFGHGFEMDDTEMHTITHPGVIVIAAAMATGEAAGISGRQFLLSVIAGYEGMLRAGMAARDTIFRSFHGTPVSGPFGSAAAAAMSYGFDEEMMINAFGIAGSQARGIAEYSESGGSIKRVHAGFASQGGVQAAILAKYGVTGPSTVLEGKKGFTQAFSNVPHPEELTRDFGAPYRILWTGVKPYCCCAAQHTTIDAVSAMKKEDGLKAEDVAEITVAQANREIRGVGNIIEPHDIVSAQFSGRFGIALRLCKDSNGFNDYVESNLKDPALLELVHKINYVHKEEYETGAPDAAPVTVTVKRKDGSVLEREVVYAKGTINVPLTRSELEDKFRELTSRVVTPARAQAILDMVWSLDELDSVSRLTSLLVSDR